MEEEGERPGEVSEGNGAERSGDRGWSAEQILVRCAVLVVLTSLLLACFVVAACVSVPAREDPRDRCGAETERAWQLQRMILSTFFGFLSGIGAAGATGRRKDG